MWKHRVSGKLVLSMTVPANGLHCGGMPRNTGRPAIALGVAARGARTARPDEAVRPMWPRRRFVRCSGSLSLMNGDIHNPFSNYTRFIVITASLSGSMSPRFAVAVAYLGAGRKLSMSRSFSPSVALPSAYATCTVLVERGADAQRAIDAGIKRPKVTSLHLLIFVSIMFKDQLKLDANVICRPSQNSVKLPPPAARRWA